MSTQRRTVMVGGDGDGNRLYVTITLNEKHDGPYETVHHDHVDTITRLSITGEVWNDHNVHEPWMCGQVSEWLDEVTIPIGHTRADMADLRDVWDKWHLNDMRAGCAHQHVVWEDSKYGTRPSLDDTLPCKRTGYRYGSSWLVEPLPSDVRAKVDHFLKRGSWAPSAAEVLS